MIRRIFLALLAGVAIAFHACFASSAEAEKREERRLGSYLIEIFGQPDPTANTKQVLQISRNGEILATIEDYGLAIDRQSIGDSQFLAPKFGENVTGNGIPNLVVVAFNGNVGGQVKLHIFELGREFRKVFELDDYVDEFKKLKNQSDWKIFLTDAAGLNVEKTPTNPGKRVVLAFDPRTHRYEFSAAAMRRPAPSTDQLKKIAKDIRSNPLWDDQASHWLLVGNALLDLIYSGNGNHFDKLLDMVWNPKFEGKGDIGADMIGCYLPQSAWWPNLAALNGWPVHLPQCSS